MTSAIVKFSPEDSKRIGAGIVKALKKDSKATGRGLLKVAKSNQERAFAEKIVNRVAELIQHRSNLFVARDKLLKEIDLFDRRIAAIEDGKFTVNFSGNIIFEDSTLGETWQ